MTKLFKTRIFGYSLSFFVLLLCLFCMGGCKGKTNGKVTQYVVKVIASYPHDTRAYTQGLFIHDGVLYESTGLNGLSSLRKVDMETGYAAEIHRLPNQIFAEGACVWKDKIYQLTWQNQVCFVYDIATLKQTGEFQYAGDGWGLTADGKQLIMSDGSSIIKFLNPDNFTETRRINVTYEGVSLSQLNELEYIDGEIWANVYMEDYIVRIDPSNGKVVGVIFLQGLLPGSMRTPQTDVLNGIAYDSATKKIYVTGKNWPLLYEIKVVPIPAQKK